MSPLQPILVIRQFRAVHQELLTLLEGLSAKDWTAPTVCAGCTVKDVAAHLLGGDIGRLSTCRDGLYAAGTIQSHSDLVQFIHRANAEWVQAARRISPRLLLDLLRLAGAQANDYWSTLDPYGRACFPVSWAGESESQNWFDLAREYTERWHHQQQIRDAAGAPGLTGRDWLHPVLDTFLRALPFGYSRLPASHGTSIAIQITGDAGGEWTLRRHAGRWELIRGGDPDAAATLTTDADTAWRLFTKGLTKDAAARRVAVAGDSLLAQPLFSTLAILA